MIKNADALQGILKGVKIGEEELTPSKLIDLITAQEEHEITVDENIHVLSNEQFEHVKKEAQGAGYKEGKTAGEEMFAKTIKQSLGIDAPGKDVETVLTLSKEKILGEAKIPEKEKVTSLTKDIETLRQTLQQKESEFTQKLTEKDQAITRFKEDTFLSSSFPEVKGFKKKHLITAFKSDGFGVAFDDQGNMLPAKNGEIIKNQYLESPNFEKVFGDWLTENGYNPQHSGGSNGSSGGSSGASGTEKFADRGEAYKHMKENSIDPLSEEGQKLLSSVGQN